MRSAAGWRRPIDLIVAFILPFVVQAMVIVAAHRWPEYQPMDRSLLAAYAGMIGLGFFFLVRALRYWALLAALVYVPAMALLLLWFALAFNGVVYDYWL